MSGSVSRDGPDHDSGLLALVRPYPRSDCIRITNPKRGAPPRRESCPPRYASWPDRMRIVGSVAGVVEDASRMRRAGAVAIG